MGRNKIRASEDTQVTVLRFYDFLYGDWPNMREVDVLLIK
jgi:hypothetical protein